ncbi:dTDP-glucose 4,6-dehydratase [Prochlorococcus marinus]|uniref:dTDP-glucose 4,6-dehydratase n=1 Tax=Prochlorococcus marinus TaxID=1219 RepID=UPI001ADAB104|nr:dTDP-glucose 4,6-dehydratase [Prochlorococcus marinus]MBO8217681.1 dTDP-glucose 4,6-dehydratase [Prochlorococcus marinus XMU1405]MBW3040844.1 dTDP-glucose 4,6-dehydratase [Prochlorococcus marinus str. MU1405]MBW3048303.1 dTDP-glucose 4,6-dehydratase [Prochlorococcus marinus str. MU1406]
MKKNLKLIQNNLVELLENKKILITGGAGFIGGTLIRRLLKKSEAKIYNLDKLTYCSDLQSINQLLKNSKNKNNRYSFYKIDLFNQKELLEIICNIKPDIIMHLAAESHVDRSIDNADLFLKSNVIGTYNLLEAVKKYYSSLKNEKKNKFIFHHISTDEVFGTLGDSGKFNEETNYNPRSPYSATKASSDHLVRSWYHTFNLPIIITNCSNNFGPWQFPEKLIPLVIRKAILKEKIPIYGDGLNIRDWLFVEDHIDALLLVIIFGNAGETYCVGGGEEKTNIDIVKKICKYLDLKLNPTNSYLTQIDYVADRPGHDYRYSIDSSLIKKNLGWIPEHNFDTALFKTIDWYINNQNWCEKKIKDSGYQLERIGN